MHLGMTAEQVLPLVRGGIIRMNAVLPPNLSDDDGLHRADLSPNRDGTFNWFGGPKAGSRKVSEAQALMLTKQKMSDGYEWRWICDPYSDTRRNFAFAVTFGRDGRVKEVRDRAWE